ncbi:MAG: hypothetical protein ACW99G_15500 [Candidatus Thorarchaeota archaeon]
MDRNDEAEAFKRISEIVGPDEATRLIAQRRKKSRRMKPKDPLLEE